MQIALFGAGGYIGRHIAAHFNQIGLSVIRYSSASEGTFNPDTGFLADSVVIAPGTDCVIYLSQSPYYRQKSERADHMWGVNVVSAMKVAELARRVGVKRFIYASTGNVYSPSFSPLKEGFPVCRDNWYSLSKVHAEECLALFNNDMSVTSARIFGVYGPGQTDKLVPNLVRSIQSGVTINLAPKQGDSEDDGGLKVSLCYIDDIVDVFSKMLHKSGPEIINIAGSEVLSVRDVAQAVGVQLGIVPKFETGGQPRAFDLVADISELVGLYNPKFTPFSEGIRQTLES